ncbi:hypothetical protein [Microviridae phi-CA82]|uniref:hypothetical protein n=1 Tax=Microviridae phi-CA82 TaxID=913970 RepID=UPI000215DF84|nr:hypothetical protein [Microviridae phi-CA82]ADP89811.1 hypothetical protein [Microviridae phi-CA82]
MSQKGGNVSVNEIIQLVSSLGFPIVCCFVCFGYINKKDENHKYEIDNLRKVIEQNTIVTEKLVSAIERGDAIERKENK